MKKKSRLHVACIIAFLKRLIKIKPSIIAAQRIEIKHFMANSIASSENFVLIEASGEQSYKWLDAVRSCKDTHTSLATIDSPALQVEAHTLSAHCTSSEVVIGAVVMNGRWTWSVMYFLSSTIN